MIKVRDTCHADYLSRLYVGVYSTEPPEDLARARSFLFMPCIIKVYKGFRYYNIVAIGTI